ncbi:dual specificity protein phosphatase family protein [Shimia biformata]|uniref:dual specificity protein phosphatase family protein n=1 Tax=Shimia biformata TaxID=1294299 RepID=UPI001950B7C7|nr:dual specificity protein phosphatase family protein [Shimia biformata]
MSRKKKHPLTPSRIVDDEVLRIEADIPGKAWRKFYFGDHHILRIGWTNFDRVADGLYRSNQPDVRRFRAMAEFGIKSVLNLRGESKTPFYRIIKESCEAFGMTLFTISGLSASRAPKRESLLQVFDVFDTAQKPLLVHCKSGADRTGLVSMMYLIDQEGLSVAEARPHLSFRYAHIRRSKAGILDLLIDNFEKVEGQKSLRDWIAEDYDSEALTRQFKSK